MGAWLVSLACLLPVGDVQAPSNQKRTIEVGGTRRSYLLHVPASYAPERPAPVVLAFHGLGMNGAMLAYYSGLNEKSDQAGFLAVYPNGTGIDELLLAFNAGLVRGSGQSPDDIGFTRALLDDLATVAAIDPRRIYATGLSNGGMMCYRLAAEMPDRIAAIAPVAGTLVLENRVPKRPVPVMHFHGTKDKLVPYAGPSERWRPIVDFNSVDETISTWVKLNGCRQPATVRLLPDAAEDATRVTRTAYEAGPEGAEVILFTIDGGGHTWPKAKLRIGFLGATTRDISANDLMWDFFERHPLAERPASE